MGVEKKILEDTLKQPFEMGKYIKFVTEFFKRVEVKTSYIKNEKIWGEYKDQIKSYTRIGRYIDPNKKKIDILAVELQKESTLERGRSLQRNFVSRLITGRAIAAIVAFYDLKSDTWRLSFIKLDYTLTPKGVKLEVTPAKRHSYLVGKGEGIHTVEKQLLPIFENADSNPTLDQIEEAFSVETVTKEFFNSYKVQYLRLYKYLQENKLFDELSKKYKVGPKQYAKKLMGQLAFLYFLQKKGWLGVSVAPEILTAEQFNRIYEAQGIDAREVFEQHYRQLEDGDYRRCNTIILEKNKHKGDLFAGCFTSAEDIYKPWGSGNKQFIRSIYRHCTKKEKNFFHYYLQPLFYNALNRPRGENDYFPRFNSKIPFLNGGLFEPMFGNWEEIDFNIPNYIFSKEGNNTKEEGILDVFDTFNFTINEDEPLEREVAVDPEMLGKIFENLLDIEERKSKGAFYTPREIVHYMCQESIANYLVNEIGLSYEDVKQFILYGESITNQDSSKKTLEGEQERVIPLSIYEKLDEIDEKLERMRVVDPAVGSGAFPLGILNEIVKIRHNITQYKVNSIPKRFQRERVAVLKERNPYNLKWKAIQESIFAVDIDPSAVDITKLRLWLSLVVDQQIDDVNERPHALPNLDCNIMCGNSLIEEFEGIQLFDEKLLENVNLSKPVQEKQVNATQLTLDIAKKDQELDTMFKELFAMQGMLFGEDDPARKIEIKVKIEKKTSDIIDYKLNEIDKNHEAARRYRKSIESHETPYFLWKLEFARVFKEKEGFDIVIGNPPYIDSENMVNSGMEVLRNTISNKYEYARGNWDIYIVFFELGFKMLSNQGTLCYITPDKWISKPFGDEMRKHLINHISSILAAGRDVFETALVDSIITFVSKKNKNKLNVLTMEDLKSPIKYIREIDKKILKSPFKLDIIFSDYIDLIYKLENEFKRLDNKYICENACATSDCYKLKEILYSLDDYSCFSEEKHLKVINTGTIGRFNSKWGEQPMKYLKDKYRFPVVDKEIFLEMFSNSYGKKSIKSKIIIKGLTLLDNCIDDTGIIIPGKSTMMIECSDSEELKYLSAIINSKLMIFFIKQKYSSSSYNGGISFTKEMINSLPWNENRPYFVEIVNYVREIIAIKSNSINKETHGIEREINKLVYETYNLTQEEINIIEASK